MDCSWVSGFSMVLGNILLWGGLVFAWTFTVVVLGLVGVRLPFDPLDSWFVGLFWHIDRG